MNHIFDRFRRKLLIEALCKSLLIGALIASGIELAFLIVMHLISYNPGWLWIGCVFVIPFLVIFSVLLGFVYYPTQKRIAKRIDQSGLNERAGTMLEFKDRNSTILEMQRNDAIQRIKDTKLKQIPFRISPKVVIACFVLMALSAGSLFVPYDIMDMFRAEASSIEKAEAERIRLLLEALRKTTAEADVAEDIKNELNDGFDVLEENLKHAEGELDKAAQISEAETGVRETLESRISKVKIGMELQKFASTADLGRAIVSGDSGEIAAALEKMKTQILNKAGNEQADYLQRIASDIEKALVNSGVLASDGLYTVLTDFSNSLKFSAEKVLQNKAVSDEVAEIIEKTKAELLSILEPQNKIEELLEALLDLLGGAKKDILNADYTLWETDSVSETNPESETSAPETEPAESEDPQETKAPQSDNPENNPEENPDSDSQPSDVDPNQTGGSNEGVIPSMSEEIYDPSMGIVEYGQVFAAYYAEYLTAVSEGKVPADVQELLEKYFESLNN